MAIDGITVMPVLQEDVDHQHDQDERFQQRLDHLLDRLVDETRGVVEDAGLQIRREALREPSHFLLYAARHGQRVRSG
jgi:hypothetical protein